MAVTKEQIIAAADQIAAAGERPTLEAVRQIVGGSYTTISPVLNEWKARQKEATAPLREPAEILPPVLAPLSIANFTDSYIRRESPRSGASAL